MISLLYCLNNSTPIGKWARQNEKAIVISEIVFLTIIYGIGLFGSDPFFLRDVGLSPTECYSLSNYLCGSSLIGFGVLVLTELAIASVHRYQLKKVEMNS